MTGAWLRRIWYLINRSRLKRELQEDMEAHREMMGDHQKYFQISVYEPEYPAL
jgi:hypothetical protein